MPRRARFCGVGGDPPADAVEKQRCTDCFHCQGCSGERCRLCRKHGHSAPPTLAGVFTYGEYLEWKKRHSIPVSQGEDPL